MPITMVKSGMTSLPISIAKQEMTAFSCVISIDQCRFHRKGVYRYAEYNFKSKMSSLPVSVPKQEVTAFSRLLLIDPYCFHRKGVSLYAENNALIQNPVLSCLSCTAGSCHLNVKEGTTPITLAVTGKRFEVPAIFVIF